MAWSAAEKELIQRLLDLPLLTNSASKGTLQDMLDGVTTTLPEVPATPNAQDIATALVTLGLATQAEA